MSSELAIAVENLGKCYQIYDRPHQRLLQMFMRGRRRYYREFWALRDLSFNVMKGETVGIIGRNGSGKSTLLQLIAGTLNPTTGRVETHGRVAALLELGSGFDPDFSGRENVFLNGAVLGLSRAEIERRFDEIAAFADIGDFLDQPVKTYSSGMMLRLAFAVSVCVDPDILLVDEALSVGDAGFQFKCLDRLRDLTSRGTTLVFVAHDMNMVKNFCSRAIYLADGLERGRGAPEDLAEQYAMDLRDQQRRNFAGRSRVFAKPPIGDPQGKAWGTDEGGITSARFSDIDAHFSSFLHGERVRIDIGACFKASLTNATLSILILDQKMLPLGGRHFELDGTPDGAGMVQSTLRVEFVAALSAGRYYLTLRLENRAPDEKFEPIDKQVGALSMEILDAGRGFIGPVDLGLQRVE